ncbi:MAG: hypothetical protein MAG458_00990 [Nitrosopumilus sp.]|nr:hypothetical protein [Nitrosopumilus sp.]
MENILEILESGNKEEKIRILETLENSDNEEILEKIISKFDDDEIQVRGEAFSSLVSNKNGISKILINNLNSTNKNIKCFTILILANRNEVSAIPEIIKLTKDKHASVRSYAIGSLGYLKAYAAKEIILESILDSNLEVKKSALKSMIDLDIPISKELEIVLMKGNHPEIEKLLLKLKK